MPFPCGPKPNIVPLPSRKSVLSPVANRAFFASSLVLNNTVNAFLSAFLIVTSLCDVISLTNVLYTFCSLDLPIKFFLPCSQNILAYI